MNYFLLYVLDRFNSETLNSVVIKVECNSSSNSNFISQARDDSTSIESGEVKRLVFQFVVMWLPYLAISPRL